MGSEIWGLVARDLHKEIFLLVMFIRWLREKGGCTKRHLFSRVLNVVIWRDRVEALRG